MTRLQHLQAAVMAVILLVGGEVFFMTPEGQHSLRGTDDFAQRLEKRANDTLDSFMKTIGNQTLDKEELVSIIDRLKDIEVKIQEPVPKKKDIADLQSKLSNLDEKLKSHEDTSVNDKDLKALEERLSAFESKIENKSLTDNDLATLKKRMSAFEKRLEVHKDGTVKKEDLDAFDKLISKMEKNVGVANGENDSAQPIAKGVGTSKVIGANYKPSSPQKTTSEAEKPNKPTKKVVSDTSNMKKAKQNDAPRSVTVPKLNAQELALLNTFSPKASPIMGRSSADIENPIRTRVLLLSPKKWLKSLHYEKGPERYISSDVINMALDGLEKSPYFDNLEPAVVRDHVLKTASLIREKKDVVWIVDSRNLAPRTYTTFNIDEEVLHVAQQTVKYQSTLSPKPNLKVVFIDYQERSVGRDSNCGAERRALIKLLGAGNVRQVVGRVAVDRHWDAEKSWIDPGTIWNNQDYTCSGTRTIYAPFTVRSNYVEEVERLFPKYLGTEDANQKDRTPVDTNRPLDVAHFWDQTQAKSHSRLRGAVSEVLSSLHGTMAGTRKIKAFSGTAPDGQSSAEPNLKRLLITKIVVVTQDDIWEDNYQLFEALAGGAMVMTDPMLSLPAGLVDGENVVLYNSRDELKELLLYYLDPEHDDVRLEIARNGYEIAMGQHRSQHQMEGIFFGEPLSTSTRLSPISSNNDEKKIDSGSVSIPSVQKSADVQVSPDKKEEKKQTAVVSSDQTPKKHPLLNSQELALLETFNPKHAPILGDVPADINNPARVRVLLMSPKKRKMRGRERNQVKGNMGLIGDEMINIVLDGLKRSPYFENLEPTVVRDHKADPDFVLEEPKDVIWVVDARNLTAPSYHYSVDEEVLIAAKATVKYQQSLNTNKKPSLSVVFVDYHDKLAGRPPLCSPEREELIQLLGVGNVRHVVGKVVAGRKWNESKRWPEPGTIWENKDFECFGKPTLRAPYTVRSDHAEAVQRLFPKFLPPGAKNKKQLTPVDTVRPLDVIHYWDQQQKKGRPEYRYYSELRNAVSEVVSSLNGTMTIKKTISSFAGTVSTGGSVGRTEVADAYLESLLTTKIVVVAQRDLWEDHYRLFEAFAGGAMVMTDRMLSLPAGLVDGESVVMYRSLEDLRQKLLHFLQPAKNKARLSIARKGYEVAMGQHRSYHRMEEVFYGKVLSPPTLPSTEG